mmetsp:Transcript_787/g.1948  ORF Transcript_787/g.1948 Transcript_787/m.1948 type:complete len:214 (+) Transcript_787:2036-2677(+)
MPLVVFFVSSTQSGHFFSPVPAHARHGMGLSTSSISFFVSHPDCHWDLSRSSCSFRHHRECAAVRIADISDGFWKKRKEEPFFTSIVTEKFSPPIREVSCAVPLEPEPVFPTQTKCRCPRWDSTAVHFVFKTVVAVMSLRGALPRVLFFATPLPRQRAHSTNCLPLQVPHFALYENKQITHTISALYDEQNTKQKAAHVTRQSHGSFFTGFFA